MLNSILETIDKKQFQLILLRNDIILKHNIDFTHLLFFTLNQSFKCVYVL